MGTSENTGGNWGSTQHGAVPPYFSHGNSCGVEENKDELPHVEKVFDADLYVLPEFC